MFNPVKHYIRTNNKRPNETRTMCCMTEYIKLSIACLLGLHMSVGIMRDKLVNDCVSSTACVDKYIHDLMKSKLYLNSVWLIFGHCMKNFSAHIHRFKKKKKICKMV